MTNPARARLAQELRGHGIEIGPLHLPLAVPAGVKVTYVDRMSLEDLRKEYPELADQELTPVDLIGSADDLSGLTDRSVDFVIANHLIEHTEDPIRVLAEFYRVLRREGLLFMAVPDSRVTFDQRRSITSIDHLIEEHRRGEPAIVAHRPLHYQDWVENVECSGLLPGYPVLTPAQRAARVDWLMERDYSIHFHVWDHTAFVRFFQAACAEEHLDLQVVEIADTLPLGGNELIVVARKEPSFLQRAQTRRRRRGSVRASLKATLKGTPAGPLLARAYRATRRLR